MFFLRLVIVVTNLGRMYLGIRFEVIQSQIWLWSINWPGGSSSQGRLTGRTRTWPCPGGPSGWTPAGRREGGSLVRISKSCDHAIARLRKVNELKQDKNRTNFIFFPIVTTTTKNLNTGFTELFTHVSAQNVQLETFDCVKDLTFLKPESCVLLTSTLSILS